MDGRHQMVECAPTMSPSRLLHTIDESEEEVVTPNCEEMVKEENGPLEKESIQRELPTILEEGREGEGVKEMEEERDRLQKQSLCLQNENSALRGLVEQLKESGKRSEGSGGEESEYTQDLRQKLREKQDDLNSMQLQLIYKKDQFDNLFECAQKMGEVVGIEDSALNTIVFCENFIKKYQESESLIVTLREKINSLNENTGHLEEKITGWSNKLIEILSKYVSSFKEDESNIVEHFVALEHQLRMQLEDTPLRELSIQAAETIRLLLIDYKKLEDDHCSKSEMEELQRKFDDMAVTVTKNAGSEQAISDLQTEKDRLLREKEELERENGSMRELASQRENELMIVGEQNKSLLENTHGVNALNEQFTSAVRDLECSKSEVIDVRKALEEEKRSKDQMVVRISELDCTLSETYTIIDKLSKETSSLSTSKSNLEEEIVVLKQQLSQNCVTQSDLSALMEEKSSLLREKEELQQKSNDGSKKIAELETSVSDLKQKLATEEEVRSNECSADLECVRSSNAQLTDEVASLTAQLDTKSQELTKVEESLLNCEEKIAEYQKGVSVLQGERQQMLTALTQKHQESVAYHAEVQRLNGVIQQLAADHSSQIAAIKKERDEFKDSDAKDSLLKECDALKTRLNSSESSLSTVSHEKNRLSQEREQLMVANSQFNMQYQDLTKEMVSLQDQLDKSNKEVGRLKDHLLTQEEQHTNDLLTSQQSVTRLKQTNAQLQEKIQAHSLLFSATR